MGLKMAVKLNVLNYTLKIHSNDVLTKKRTNYNKLANLPPSYRNRISV